MLSSIHKTYTQIAGLLHDLRDRLSDASRPARHGLRELQEQIRQAEKSVAAPQALAAATADKAEAAALAPAARYAPPLGMDGRPVAQRAALLSAFPPDRSDDLFNPLIVLSFLSGAAHACGGISLVKAEELSGALSYLDMSQESAPTFDADNSN